MRRIFCTLFDKNYLYQGVVLHRSLERHAKDFRLYALCMDSIAFALIQKIASDTLIPIYVDDVVTPEVAAIRQGMTHGQFCWTCQPLICQFVLERYAVDMVTYLESDSMFFSDPEILFEELGLRSISLVPHNYSYEFDNTETAGKFCVQFNAFRNDSRARAVLSSWMRSCFKYHKTSPNVYPGQTCLDEWPERYDGVCIIENYGAGVAPWNVRGYRLDSKEGAVLVNGVPVVFYHYHQYGRFKSGAHELGSYPMTRRIIELFYRPYITELREVERIVRLLDPEFTYRREYSDHNTLSDVLNSLSFAKAGDYFQVLKRKFRGRYNVYPEAYFSEQPSRAGEERI